MAQGSTLFARHVTAGVLTSLSDLSGSIGRNAEQLSMDAEYVAMCDSLRASGGAGAGLQGLGLSLLAAVAGTVDGPLRMLSGDAPVSARQVAAEVARGMVGLVTKPVGGAMGLLHAAGSGLRGSTGVHPAPLRRPVAISMATPPAALGVGSARSKTAAIEAAARIATTAAEDRGLARVGTVLGTLGHPGDLDVAALALCCGPLVVAGSARLVLIADGAIVLLVPDSLRLDAVIPLSRVASITFSDGHLTIAYIDSILPADSSLPRFVLCTLMLIVVLMQA